ncbi:hypothetical protein Q757_05485 [Oenococcus alcoholitolerans]|uniref:Uncharacterized protein n=1 Tax=Oenococcus alcoholitolerans TaxID=931074 RepID=A0ABR4XQR4_9LACO|nr:hypothetical protein Q757_05485 [Oenococcus alcoholitolerans]
MNNPTKIAPQSAPIVVNISKNIANLMFNRSSFKYATEAPEDVPMTAIIDAAMAYLIGRFNARTKIGVIIMPPPRPRTDPKVPAKKTDQYKYYEKALYS